MMSRHTTFLICVILDFNFKPYANISKGYVYMENEDVNLPGRVERQERIC